MRYIYNSKQNTLKTVSSVSPPFLPGEMYLHIFKNTRSKNRQNTGYRSCYMLYISCECSNVHKHRQCISQIHFISVWLRQLCCSLQRNTVDSGVYCNIYLEMHVYWNTQKGKSETTSTINVSLLGGENIKLAIIFMVAYDGLVYNWKCIPYCYLTRTSRFLIEFNIEKKI